MCLCRRCSGACRTFLAGLSIGLELVNVCTATLVDERRRTADWFCAGSRVTRSRLRLCIGLTVCRSVHLV